MAWLLSLMLFLAPAPVSFRWIQPRVTVGRSDVHTLVDVPLHDENRGLTVLLDSDGYSTSTYEQLDGVEATVMHEVWFKSVPEGRYVVAAVLHRVHTDIRALDNICIGGPDVDCIR
jgi:hypothetical protein